MKVDWDVARVVLDTLFNDVEKVSDDLVVMVNYLIIGSPDDVFWNGIKSIRENADRVSSKFSDEISRSEALLFLAVLTSWGVVARNTMRIPPDDVLDAVSRIIRYRFKMEPRFPELDRDVVFKLIKSFMFLGYIDGKLHVLIMPTPDELRYINFVGQLLNSVVGVFINHSLIDYRDGVVLLGDKELFRVDDEVQFLKSCSVLFKDSRLCKRVYQSVIDKYSGIIRSKVSSLGFDEDWVSSGVRFKKDTSVSEFGRLLGVNLNDNSPLNVELVLSPFSGCVTVIFRKSMPVLDGKELMYECSIPVSDIDNLKDKLLEAFKTALSSFEKWDRIAGSLEKTLLSNGFTVNEGGVYKRRMMLSKITIFPVRATDSNGTYNVSVSVNFEFTLDSSRFIELASDEGIEIEPSNIVYEEEYNTAVYWNTSLSSESEVEEFVSKTLKLVDIGFKSVFDIFKNYGRY